MSEKVYVTPNLKEPEFIIVPRGQVNEQGIKLRRKSINFQPNHRGVGQFKTSDPVLQKFLENHENFKTGRLVLVGESNMVKDVPKEKEDVKPDIEIVLDEPKKKKKK